MVRTIIVSNRLPFQIKKQKKNITYRPSIGGLATGLKSVHSEKNSLWLGWCGIEDEKLEPNESRKIENDMKNNCRCVPVFLSHEDVELFYNSFSNKTLWPLFHHFPMLTEYRNDFWQGYQSVNEKFFNKLKTIIGPKDRIWVHDYQLLLLPELIRDHFPKTQIGFFLHIPFPSYEIFRLLPWREEILNGILGADLVGFHTYDYTRHFLSSVRRILHLDAQMWTIHLDHRQSHVDVFPMGIDYHKYRRVLKQVSVKNQIDKFRKVLGNIHVILSVDRLDYTKGIPNRLYAFDRFLEMHPEWKEKTALVLIVAPSRTDVDTYLDLKKELDELVSRINSKHGKIGWIPVTYFYRSFSFKGLSALYGLADILLVTPLRDGMNLVVKEYIASRKDNAGVVILSETTGAASELGEAIIVNANNVEEIAHAIHKALNIDSEDQKHANELMNRRIEQNSVDNWAKDFLDKLGSIVQDQQILKANILNEDRQNSLLTDFQKAGKRLVLFDYDGTLVSFQPKPELAKPDAELLDMLKKISKDTRNELVIISGRDKEVIEDWLGDLPVHLVAGHGVWIRVKGHDWDIIESMDYEWKETIRPVLEFFVHRTPGSFIEEKCYSLAWHFRKCDPDFANTRLSELKATLMVLTNNLNIGVLEGNKVIEVKNTSINKGRAVSLLLSQFNPDFILAVGDDWTDEDMFMALPDNAYSIKVRYGYTKARYTLENVDRVRNLVKQLV